MFTPQRCNAHAISQKANQRNRAASDIVVASLQYFAKFEDRDGEHHPWVFSLSPASVPDYTQLVPKAKSIGFSRVSESWLRPGKRLRHVLYVEIRDIKWLNQRQVRVQAYVCLDANDEVLTEAMAILTLKLSKNKWSVDRKASSFEVGE